LVSLFFPFATGVVVVDPCGAPWGADIFTKYQKNLKCCSWDYLGPHGVADSWKKL
jgi:hypothetical protein